MHCCGSGPGPEAGLHRAARFWPISGEPPRLRPICADSGGGGLVRVGRDNELGGAREQDQAGLIGTPRAIWRGAVASDLSYGINYANWQDKIKMQFIAFNFFCWIIVC